MNFEKNSKIKNPDSDEKISKWNILVNEIRIVLWKCYHVMNAYAKRPRPRKILITWKDWKLYYPNRNLSGLETFRRVFESMPSTRSLIGWDVKASILLNERNQFENPDRKIGKMGKKKQSRNCFLVGVSKRGPFMTSLQWRHLSDVIGISSFEFRQRDFPLGYCEIIDIYIWDPVKSKSS